MNKTLLIVMIAIVVLIGGFFWLSNKSNAPITNNQPASTNLETINPKINGVQVSAGTQMETGTIDNTKIVVTYDGSTFSPKTVTIKKGETVTFINESGGGMSVASDPHPTHTNYPAFDQYKSSEKGQKSYTFVFDKIGSWGYHNHLNSGATGTVVVE